MSIGNSNNSLSNILKNKPTNQQVKSKTNIDSDVKSLFNCVESIDAIKDLSLDDVKGVIIELGSNEQATENLKLTRSLISSVFSKVFWSTEYLNPDYTATANNAKPDFTNQCGYIYVDSKVNLENFESTNFNDSNHDMLAMVQFTKEIERHIKNCYLSNKDRKTNSDDIHRNKSNSNLNKIYKGNKPIIIDIDVLAIKTEKGMIAFKERYPFKQHEWVGITELVEKGYLD